MTIPISNEYDARVAELRRKLEEFYATTSTYPAFQEDFPKYDFWQPIRDVVAEIIARKGTCRVLEFGAGRGGFGDFLAGLRSKVELHVQDVTAQNLEILTTKADRVFISDITAIREKYDVIFSTFVWEHLTNPVAVLNHALNHLELEGRLIIASPRYDFPFYIPRSARHYSRSRQALLSLWLLAQRFLARQSTKARFLIHLDPAVLHQPWFQDSDAIHWPSIHDVLHDVPAGYAIRCLSPIGSASMRLKFFRRFLLLFVEFRRIR